MQQGGDSGGIGRFQTAFLFRQTAGQHHARRHRFAVQPHAVAHFRFDGMAERMPQVQPGADAAFGFVGGDDFSLHLAAVIHRLRQQIGLLCHQPGHIAFQPVQKFRIAQHAVFDHFGHAGGKLARRQSGQNIQIGKHRLRLVKRADHILAQRMIDGGFAAHRRIDLAQQCGRYLDKGRAALVGGGGKPDRIADYAAAERNQRRAAFGPVFQQFVVNMIERLPVFKLLAVGQDDGEMFRPQLVQGRLNGGQIQRRDSFIGNDGGFFADIRADVPHQSGQQVLADEDGVAVRRRGNGERVHDSVL